MKQRLARIIWDISEYTGIGLGMFAPHVFGAMIGARPHKVEKSKNTYIIKKGQSQGPSTYTKRR